MPNSRHNHGEGLPPTDERETAAIAWSRIRGTTVFEARVDLHNGFPGVVWTGPRLERTVLAITAEYLIVAEGHTYGFALPLDEIVEIAVTPSNVSSSPALRVQYRDGELTRSFDISFRGPFRPLRGGHRAGQAARCLNRFSVPNLPVTAVNGLTAHTWEQAEQFSGEAMIWNGNLSGPTGGWMASDLGPCRCWITPDSLIWAPIAGEGLRRIGWSEVIDVRFGESGSPLRHSSVVVGTGSTKQVAAHYSFRFDQATDPQADHFAPKAFEAVLATTGVSAVRASRSRPPWLIRDQTKGDIDDEPPDLRRETKSVAQKPRGASSLAVICDFEKGVGAEITSLAARLEAGDIVGMSEVANGGNLANAVRALATCVASGAISVDASESRLGALKTLEARRQELRASRTPGHANLEATEEPARGTSVSDSVELETAEPKTDG